MNEFDTRAKGAVSAQDGRVIAQKPMPGGEHDLAWDLVEHSRSLLTVSELNGVFVKLGTGDNMDVIDTVLKAVVRAQATVPWHLTHRLRRWAAAYQGHQGQPRLWHLVDRTARATTVVTAQTSS